MAEKVKQLNGTWCEQQTLRRKKPQSQWRLEGGSGSILTAKPVGWTVEDELRALDARDQTLARLESAARSGDELAFLAELKGIEWGNQPASEFVRVVRLALKAGAYLAAREVSSEGARQFPDSPELQRYADGLAAPEVISRTLPPNQTLKANREWLESHFDSYKGQWVAVKNGVLLGVADSLNKLTKQVPFGEDILFTKVC